MWCRQNEGIWELASDLEACDLGDDDRAEVSDDDVECDTGADEETNDAQLHHQFTNRAKRIEGCNTEQSDGPAVPAPRLPLRGALRSLRRPGMAVYMRGQDNIILLNDLFFINCCMHDGDITSDVIGRIYIIGYKQCHGFPCTDRPRLLPYQERGGS